MNILELFKKIEDSDLNININGEFEIHKKHILWKYELKDFEDDNNNDYYSDDEYDFDYGFDSISNEETLLEIYNEDLDRFELFLDEINEFNNFDISEPIIKKTSISFKIFD